MSLNIVTIGVYGFGEEAFFQALVNAGVDTFCDIRLRRGMRGRAYAFANSNYLQQRLCERGIRYLHLKELAPSQSTRALQKQEDKRVGVLKRTRTGLSNGFIQSYRDRCLSHFDLAKFVAQLGPGPHTVALFCVEREPEACHRSILAERLATDLGTDVRHITP